jgi:hypothetical protein
MGALLREASACCCAQAATSDRLGASNAFSLVRSFLRFPVRRFSEGLKARAFSNLNCETSSNSHAGSKARVFLAQDGAARSRALSKPFVRQVLVAAGVVLRRQQHQAGASRSRLGLRRMAERAQDPEYCNVSGEDAEADGCDHGEAEDEGHQERNHSLKSFWVKSAEAGHFVSVSLNSVVRLWSVVPSLCSGRAKSVVSRTLSAND